MTDEQWFQAFHKHFTYEPDTGRLKWKVPTSNRVKEGDYASTRNDGGYLTIGFMGLKWLVHRIIFHMHHGYCPDLVDHADKSVDNNRINNLRESDKSKNAHNTFGREDNTSGQRGVFFMSDGRHKPWRVLITVAGVCWHRENFHTYGEAVSVAKKKYAELEKTLHVQITDTTTQLALQERRELLDNHDKL